MAKKVFISYSWNSEQHKKWVVQLANDLRSQYGIDVECDNICEISELNAMIVNKITKSDKIIVVITPDYTYKAENLIGGVGKETKLLYSRYFENDKSIVPILKIKANPPAYLKAVPYIDFTVGSYDYNVNKLAMRLNDKTAYEAVAVSNVAFDGDDYALIPDLRINDPNAENDFLKAEFENVDKRLMSLLQTTNNKYSAFHFTRAEKVDTVLSNCSNYINGQLVRKENKYWVVSYKFNYNDKSGSIKFWLTLNNDNFGKGIFGLFDESDYQQGYNSFNFGVTIDRTGSTLALNANMLFAQNTIKTGKQLGEHIYKIIMDRIKV